MRLTPEIKDNDTVTQEQQQMVSDSGHRSAQEEFPHFVAEQHQLRPTRPGTSERERETEGGLIIL